MDRFALIAAIALPLAACNTNTAPGNDREALIDPPAPAAPIENAATALVNVSPDLMLPATMTAADLSALEAQRACQFRFTEAAFPSFVYDGNGRGAIKINGKLIPVTRNDEGTYSSGNLRIRTRLLNEEGNAGLQMQELVIAMPGAKDELGFRGYTTCGGTSRS